MNTFKYIALTAVVVGICFTLTAPAVRAQVSVGVNIGAAPACPYGYYEAPPYACAPYGYYGPEWFTGGVFIGAGPWFHGAEGFRGPVDNRFHSDHGYKGPMPRVGEKPEPSRSFDKMPNFKGNEMRDGRGHVTKR
jgi:hypothetical protein